MSGTPILAERVTKDHRAGFWCQWVRVLGRTSRAMLLRLNLRSGQAALARAALVGLLALLVRVAFVLDFAPRPLFDSNLATGTDMEFLVGWARRIASAASGGRRPPAQVSVRRWGSWALVKAGARSNCRSCR